MSEWADRFKVVYFMRPRGMMSPIKIGCSSFPEDRLNAVSQWSPFPLELIAEGEGTHQLERFLHRKYADSRSHSEWFFPTPDLMARIERVKAGEDVASAFGAIPDPSDTAASPRYIARATRQGEAAA